MTKGDSRPDEPGVRGRMPERLSAADLADLRGEFDRQFGAQAGAVFFGSLQGPIPDDVLEVLREAIGALGTVPAGMAPPSIDEVVDAHDQLRRLAGESRLEEGGAR
jgi:hypothetical protein